jgi:hypothetical protein
MLVRQWKAGLVLSALISVVGVSMYAQQGAAPPQSGRGGPPKNLQVLPKDWTLMQVQTYMRGVAGALGVECSHCHVSQTDRASDAKPPKLVARKMLQMLNAINNDLLKGVGDPPAAGAPKVTCFTCHRGQLKPLTAPGGGD